MTYQEQMNDMIAVWAYDCAALDLPVYLFPSDESIGDVFRGLGFTKIETLDMVPCCQAGQAIFVRNGKIIPCPRFEEEEFVLAEIVDNDFVGRNVMLAIKLFNFDPDDSSLRCGNCEKRLTCYKDRCFYESYLTTGDLFSPVCE